MELIIKAIKADGTAIELYSGIFELKAVGAEILNPITLGEIQSSLAGATLQYRYNGETSSSKITDLAKLFSPMQLLLGFATISGVIDNSLDKAGITRTTDLDSKLLEMIPSSPQTVRDECKAKIERVQKIMGEVNEWFAQYKPANLPESEQYYFRHHFASPKSLAKPKSNNTNVETN